MIRLLIADVLFLNDEEIVRQTNASEGKGKLKNSNEESESKNCVIAVFQ